MQCQILNWTSYRSHLPIGLAYSHIRAVLVLVNLVFAPTDASPAPFDAKSVPINCGNTNYYGNEARCETCSEKRPWYICVHGNDVSEYMCGDCEFEADGD